MDTSTATILASYQPPEALFETPEPLSLELDSHTLKEILTIEESAGQSRIRVSNSLPSPSEPSRIGRYKSGHSPKLAPSVPVSTRATKVVHIDYAPSISNAGVRGMVTNVSHGTFHGQPASLIIFSFLFRSGDHGFRFKKTNVKITFANPPGAPSTLPGPTVRKFAPRKIYGLPTVEGKTNRIGGDVSLQVPVGTLTVGPSIHGEKEWEYMKEHRFGTVGQFWSSKRDSGWDIVYWETRENKITHHGVPDTLNCAVIVEHSGAFTASVEVTVDTPVANGPFAFPWSKNAPVLFVPGIAMGNQPRTAKFEDFSEAEWRAMIPYEEEWESRFLGESRGAKGAGKMDEGGEKGEEVGVIEGIEESDDR